MNVDSILETFNQAGADYILIGGMNFLLNHKPLLTFDVDLWVSDTPENLAKVNSALRSLNAEWGTTSENFKRVPEDPAWLNHQMIYCLYTPVGDLDIFRAVRGLQSFHESRANASLRATPAGISYMSLSDQDMLACQFALEEREQKLDRIRILREAIEKS